ncbi:MAG: TrmB family transcriptional regulator [Thermoplasmata archaeon]
MLEDAVQSLKGLGLTEYEARVYAALVGLGEGSVRQVYRASNVPRPRIYDILEKLAKKGFVEVRHGSPMCVRPIEPNVVLSKLRAEFEESARNANARLEDLGLSSTQTTSPLWYVRGEWSIRNRAEKLICGTRKELLILAKRGSLVRDMASEISGIAETKSVKCIVTKGSRFLAGMLGKADVRELAETDKGYFDEAYKEVTSGCVIKHEIGRYRTRYAHPKAHYCPMVGTEDARCLTELILIVDGRELMLVYHVNHDRVAVVLAIPIIICCQRKHLLEFIQNSRRIDESCSEGSSAPFRGVSADRQ